MSMTEFYETPTGNGEAWSDWVGPEPAYPGQLREGYVPDAANSPQLTESVYNDTVRDFVDWDAGGIVGLTKFVGSSGGVTDSQSNDAHDFRGEMATVKRMPDTNYGPVQGGEDNNSLLGLLYSMQESSQYFPNEVSQADVMKAV